MLTFSTLLLFVAIVFFLLEAFALPKGRTWSAGWVGMAILALALVFWGGKRLVLG